MKEKKWLIYEIFIIALGFSSVLLIYTQNIYMYEKLSFKSLGLGMWIGITLWILFIINAMILTFLINKKEERFNRIRNIIRNIILLSLMSILLAYKLGFGLLKLYKMDKGTLETILYVTFGVIFVSYIIITVLINRMEDKDKLEKTRLMELNKKSNNKKKKK